MLSREQLIAGLRAVLEPLDTVEALSEGGSAAFGRADEYSDIDLIADVQPGAEDTVFAVIEETLTALVIADQPHCPQSILVRKVIPQPAWHGMAQRFYKLAATSEWLLLDIALRPTDKPGHFGERERHGEPVVLFDKTGIAQPTALDMAAWGQKLPARLAELRENFELFGNFAAKELHRGHPLDAWAFYQSMLLRPLVELLRIKHNPARYDFGLRYLQYELPAEVVQELERLHFIGNTSDLMAAQTEAREWMAELLAEFTPRSPDAP